MSIFYWIVADGNHTVPGSAVWFGVFVHGNIVRSTFHGLRSAIDIDKSIDAEMIKKDICSSIVMSGIQAYIVRIHRIGVFQEFIKGIKEVKAVMSFS